MNPFRNPGMILILVILAFLLFGANKLPKMARNMGQSMRILKSEVKEMKSDGTKDKKGKAKAESNAEDDTEAVDGTVISDSETPAKPDSEEQPSK